MKVRANLFDIRAGRGVFEMVKCHHAVVVAFVSVDPMGFYQRKTIRFGPVRLNFSRTGIGVSIGGRPGRLAVGTARTYVRMTGEGFFYRQCVDPVGRTAMSFDRDLHGANAVPADDPTGSGLVVTSSREVLSQVNSRASQAPHAPIILALTIVAMPICAFFDSFTTAWVLGVGFVLAWLFHNGDNHKRTSELLYQLTGDARAQFALMESAFATLADSRRIWLVQQEASTEERKRNARTVAGIVRSQVKVREERPPWIDTNVLVWTIDLGRTKLFFFPDRLLVWDSRKYRAVSYETLGVAFAPTRFMEDGRPPRDSEVVDRAWRYADEAGEPDPRYATNTQLPVVLYGSIIFGAQNQLLAHLHVSSSAAASRFAEVMRSSLRSTHTADDSTAAASASSRFSTEPPRSHRSARAYPRRMQGTVRWFNIEKGYGFITAQNGQQVMVILSQLLADGLRSLPEGLTVEFEIVKGARGPMAVNIAPWGADPAGSRGQGRGVNDAKESPPAHSPWEVLGLAAGASGDEVVAAYRRMAQMYHPDKVASLGPEFKELADRKMREINAAYEALKLR